MFATPLIVKTEVFARLPENLQKLGKPSDWIDSHPNLTHMPLFLEGPSFDLDGNLYCVDIAHGRIFTISTNGVFNVVAEYDGWPNGLKIDKAGKIFIADYKHGIMQLEPKTGQVDVVLERYRAERFKGVNDLVFASNGDMYFTDQGLTGLHDPAGRLFRYCVDGTLDCLLDNIPSPNGLVLSKDESALYLAVTRANAVWRVPFMPDGGVAKVGLYVQMSGGSGPDGIALDSEGGIVVAHVGFGTVWHFSPRGEPISRIVSCEGLLTTNVAFGGMDNCDLYITESETGTILRARLNIPGRHMYSHI
jgi:gluconolactonase